MSEGMKRDSLDNTTYLWPIGLVLWYLVLELGPVFINLLVIRFRSDVEEKVNNSNIGSYLLQVENGAYTDLSVSGNASLISC